MADLITIIGLTASIVQLINATTKAYGYLKDASSAEKARAKVSLEVISLVPLLTDLRLRIEQADPNDKWIENFLALGGHNGPVQQFRGAMDELLELLKPEVSKRKRIGKAFA